MVTAADDAPPPRVLHETTSGVLGPTQTYALIRTYGIGTARVRVTVQVDSHVPQSRYVAERWDGTAWQPVVRILPDDPVVVAGAASGYLPIGRSAEKQRALDRLAGLLIERCLQVL